jgi:hypothetical protein
MTRDEVIDIRVTDHAIRRFAQRFRGHDLVESLWRADEVPFSRARKLNSRSAVGDTLMPCGRAWAFHYDWALGALWIMAEGREDARRRVALTVVRVPAGR